MTQDEIKADIAAFIAAVIAHIKTTIEQTPPPPFWASEGSRAHAEHVAWIGLHLRLLDWEDVQIDFEEFLKLDQHHFDETTWRATIVRYRHADIREAFEYHDMGQLHDAMAQLYGEKAASYETQLKLKPGQRLPPPRDHTMVKAIQDVAHIRELWERHYDGRHGNRKANDCLRPERLSADYHGVDYKALLARIKNKRRS